MIGHISHGHPDLTFGGMINKDILKKIQDRFCAVGNVFAFCMDEKGRMLTEMSGSEADVRRLYDTLGQDAFFRARDSVSGSSIEDQTVIHTRFSNVRLAAVNIKRRQETVLCWVICAVLRQETVDEDYASLSEEIEIAKADAGILSGITRQIEEGRLDDVLDLFRMVTERLLDAKYIAADNERESLKSRSDNEQLSHNLRQAEALTSIVQLLGSDEPVETVFERILSIAGEFLSISSAQIFGINRDGETMDVLAEWRENEIASMFAETKNLQRSPLLYGEKPNVVSFDAVSSEEEQRLMERVHIMARVTFPLRINGRISMYAAFHESKNKRRWTTEEIRFMNDVSQVVQSILVKRIQKNSLVSSYSALESVMNHVGCSLYVEAIEDGTPLFINQTFKENFEFELKNGLESLWGHIEIPEQGEQVREIYHAMENRYYDLRTTRIQWVDGRDAVLYAIYDITEKKQYQKKIEQQAYTDYLTGLYNRMCCERDLAVQIDYARRNQQKGALLYLDLDDFKHINDGLGHQYGDVLLKSIAHSIRCVEGLQNTCYRMGGDEFVILVPVEVYPRLPFIVEEIQEIFSKPWFLKDADYYCTMSMGIVEFPDGGDSVQELIRKADIAMYEAKHSGKNRVAQYDNNLATVSSERLDMEKNMRDATSRGYKEFEVYYQPIVDLQKPGVPCIGAEALIRWNSAELGFINPAVFIPLAEYLGLINPIGNYVLHEACKAVREWNDNGYPDYKVNVNLSVVQLLQNDIVESIETAIKESGVKPQNLTLEVTESLAINDMEKMKNILGRIKAMGVRIALDDFGTGYSSLNHIREIPLDIIKVDQTFVRDLDRDSYSQAFIKMVAELAESIGVYVCVEGIEREEQLKVLEGMKVRMIQGYYFGRPMARGDFERKFAPMTVERAETKVQESELRSHKIELLEGEQNAETD